MWSTWVSTIQLTKIVAVFGEQFTPPGLELDDGLSHGLTDKPIDADQPATDDPLVKNDDHPTRVSGFIPVSDLVNRIFTVSHPPSASSNYVITDDNKLVVHVDSSSHGTIYSQIVFHTEMESIKKLASCSNEDQKQFQNAKEEEIKLLLNDTIEVISDHYCNLECEVQPLKWVLAIKRSPNSYPPIRYRARLVSASHCTELRHSVHGNSRTVGMHKIRILTSMFPTWFKIAEANSQKLVFFTRDVRKAFLQSNPSQRLVSYRPQRNSLRFIRIITGGYGDPKHSFMEM